MKEILKPIYQMITSEYVLFENVIQNYITIGIIGILAFYIAWVSIEKLYENDIISGSKTGSFLHWIVRLIIFILLYKTILIVIRIIKFCILYKYKILVTINIFTICITIFNIIKESKQKN